VGAIRWDAWVGDLPTFGAAGQPTAVGLQVERALGPARWHDRLPFYARELSAHAVEVRAASQAVLDREIAYAGAAGLDYWAFVWYPPGSGLDAGSAYAESGKGGMAFAELARAAERRWDAYREVGLRVLPWVTTGWDPRPLVENPVSWSTWDPDGWAQPGTPAEIATHLEQALTWTATFPEAADAGAVLMYAWNEFAEGGWLCPALREGTARLDAIRPVLARRGSVVP
jgi:hypothetical protein